MDGAWTEAGCLVFPKLRRKIVPRHAVAPVEAARRPRFVLMARRAPGEDRALRSIICRHQYSRESSDEHELAPCRGRARRPPHASGPARSPKVGPRAWTVWRQFVVILRALARLMPTNGAPQGIILAWCAPCRTDEPRPVRSDLCDTRLDRRCSICVATLITRTLPPLSTHHPPVTPLISPSLPTAQGLAQAEKPKPAWSGPSQPKSLHGRGDGEATSIRSSCAPARCFAAATCAPRTSGRASLMDSEDHGSSAAGSRPAQPEGAAL